MTWNSADSDPTPQIEVETIAVADFAADPTLRQEVDRAYSILDPLLKTDLTIIPQKYSPLSSRGVREQRSTMATYLCSQIKAALNMGRQGTARRDNCDAVLIKGGNIRGERDYDQYNFTLEGLRTEMQEEEGVHIFLVPGNISLTRLPLHVFNTIVSNRQNTERLHEGDVVWAQPRMDAV